METLTLREASVCHVPQALPAETGVGSSPLGPSPRDFDSVGPG